MIRNLAFLDPAYSKSKSRTIERFYSILTAHACLNSLSDIVHDPEGDGEVTRFILLCRGTKNNAKLAIINACMMFLAQHLRKSRHHLLPRSIGRNSGWIIVYLQKSTRIVATNQT